MFDSNNRVMPRGANIGVSSPTTTSGVNAFDENFGTYYTNFTHGGIIIDMRANYVLYRLVISYWSTLYFNGGSILGCYNSACASTLTLSALPVSGSFSSSYIFGMLF